MELLLMIGYVFNLILVILSKIVKGIIYGIVGFLMLCTKFAKTIFNK